MPAAGELGAGDDLGLERGAGVEDPPRWLGDLAAGADDVEDLSTPSRDSV